MVRGRRLSGSFTDPEGDTVREPGPPDPNHPQPHPPEEPRPEQRAEADIVAHEIDYGATEVAFTLVTAAPRTEGSERIRVEWLLEFDADHSGPDAVVVLDSREPVGLFRVRDGKRQFACRGRGAFQGERYVAARFAVGCLDGAPSVSAAVSLVYHPPEPELSRVVYTDEAPDRDGDHVAYDGPVARSQRHGPRGTLRLAGDDRIETAVAVSRHAVPGSGSGGVVYLARADDFPGALAAGTLGAGPGSVRGPILLVPRCGAARCGGR